MGLYPSPPDLTGMPVWGRSMEDEYIWGRVPFIQKLPDLSPDFRGDK